ncbi:hypothetical protein N7536_000167 [Penicillium majusculum]|nr:hypothetical protein N7536_000167 [Penicillium majusculum]
MPNRKPDCWVAKGGFPEQILWKVENVEVSCSATLRGACRYSRAGHTGTLSRSTLANTTLTPFSSHTERALSSWIQWPKYKDVSRPSLQLGPENVRYTNAGELDGPDIKAVLFHLFYGEYGRVSLREFYTAGSGIRMNDIDQKTLSSAFCIRRVFKANIMLRGYPSALNFY